MKGTGRERDRRQWSSAKSADAEMLTKISSPREILRRISSGPCNVCCSVPFSFECALFSEGMSEA